MLVLLAGTCGPVVPVADWELLALNIEQLVCVCISLPKPEMALLSVLRATGLLRAV